MKYIHTIISALLLSIFSSTAYALQLGDIRIASRLGEPLDAYINILVSPKDDPSSVRLEILPDQVYINNRSLTRLVERFEARIARAPANRFYIHIESAVPVTEPLIAFRLKASQGGGALIGNYSLAPRPPLPSSATRVTAKRAKVAIEQPTTDTPVMIRPVLAGSEYGPVVSGETLWGIAMKLGGGTRANFDIANRVQSLFAANPQAFIQGNIDKLKVGAVLKVPGVAPTAATAERQVGEAEVAPQVEVAEEVVPQIDASPQIEVTATVEEPATKLVDETPTATVRAPVDWRAQDPEVAARLSALKEKYAAIRQRYAAQISAQRPAAETTPLVGSSSTPPIEEPGPESVISEMAIEAPIATAADAGVRQDDTIVAAATDAEAIQPALDLADAPQTAGPPDIVPQSVSSALTALPYRVILYVCVALVFVGLLIAATRKTLAARRKQGAALSRHAEEADRKAEVQRKAEQRLRLEDEVTRMIDESDDSDDATDERAVGTGDLTTTVDLKRKVESELELPPEEEEKDDDQQILIDANIAHGRYFEAEKLLRDVVAESPLNHGAKLRLAEIYYITERVDEFLELANDLHTNHRSDISDGDWQRVMRMGKVITPDQPLFSGPWAIDRSGPHVS